MTENPHHQIIKRELWITILLQIVTLAVMITAALLLKTRWIAAFALPVILLIWLGWAVVYKKPGAMIPLSILSGIALGSAVLLLPETIVPMMFRIAGAFFCFGMGWIGIWYFARQVRGNYWWWAFVPATITFSITGIFAFQKSNIFDIAFFIGIGIGAGLLAWGLGERLFGLIIAGSIVLTTAPGVAFAWSWTQNLSVISQTGVMIAWIALGWGLITIGSRVITDRFIWWPLIPGGVLAMVGMGLYLGGDPILANTVLNSTGAMGITLFAVYLILMRTRLRQ